MNITLSVGAVSLELDGDLYWSDENSWHPVEQTKTRSITGAQMISVAKRIGGRVITLKPEDDKSAWMTSAELEQLKAWAGIPGQEMQLTLRGVTRTVVFDHPDALDGLPVVHYSDVLPDDWYRLTLRFLEI